jgi:hypothetical protein
MHNNQILRNIQPTYDVDLVYSRLGFRKEHTSLEIHDKEKMVRLLHRAEEICKLTLSWAYMDIVSNSGQEVLLNTQDVLEGRGISRFLSGCEMAVVMFSTAGDAPMEEIRILTENERLSEAVVIDAAASEIVDAGLDWLMQYLKAQLRRTGQTLTRLRYSPGYGDFPLTAQKTFGRLLSIEKMGVQVAETLILKPEKSVLAIAGVLGVEDALS